MALVLHEDDEEALEGEVVMGVHVDVALAVVDLGQDLVGEQLQLMQLEHLMHLVSSHLALDHPVYHLLPVLKDLPEGHIDGDGT